MATPQTFFQDTTDIPLRLDEAQKVWAIIPDAYDPVERVVKFAMLSWDTGTLQWVKFTGGGPGGSGLTDAELRASPVPVSGTFFPATQPVSATSLPLPTGASTETTLALIKAKTDNFDVLLSTRLKPADTLAAVTAVTSITNVVHVDDNGGSVTVDSPVGTPTFVRLSDGAAAMVGQKTMALSIPVTIASDQTETNPIFKGIACTFRTPGRTGTAGQKLLSLHNATGSAVTVTVDKISVDLMQTVVKAVTVAPPIIRAWLVTVLPTNGTALTKNDIGGSGASSGSVTVLGDASADGTGSGTTLTATLPAGAIISQEFAPRMITAAGYEVADRTEFFAASVEVTLGPLQGIVVFLDYTLATQNPVTDMWVAGIHWTEK